MSAWHNIILRESRKEALAESSSRFRIQKHFLSVDPFQESPAAIDFRVLGIRDHIDLDIKKARQVLAPGIK